MMYVYSLFVVSCDSFHLFHDVIFVFFMMILFDATNSTVTFNSVSEGKILILFVIMPHTYHIACAA